MSFPESEPQQRAGYGFEPTEWSVVLAVSAADPGVAFKALAKLCEDYWHPIYKFARGLGLSEADAKDAVQGFMEHLIGNEGIKKASEDRGRFRTFLISSFRHYLISQFAKSRAQKRGGEDVFVQFDESITEKLTGEMTEIPDRAYEKAFAEALLAKCLKPLETEYQRLGNAELFNALLPHLAATGDQGIQEVSVRLGMKADAVRTALSRFRRKYRGFVESEIRRMVANEEDFRAELLHLVGVFDR